MAQRKIKRVSRGRKLTRREAARYDKIREQVEAEKPLINARIRSRLATLEAVRQIGRELKDLRQAQGKSLSDVRRLTGMDRAAISKLERGDRENPSMDTLIRYAQALGKTLVLSIEDSSDAGTPSGAARAGA
jgi:DNA-binding XRE family transcriptional regulator